MRKSLLVIALTTASTLAFAQYEGQAKPGGVQVQGAGGVQIQGNTNINASAQNMSATAVGKGNTAKNAVGAIKAGTQIQGNTNINASAKNVSATAVGKGNTATNDVGTIGGK